MINAGLVKFQIQCLAFRATYCLGWPYYLTLFPPPLWPTSTVRLLLVCFQAPHAIAFISVSLLAWNPMSESPFLSTSAPVNHLFFNTQLVFHFLQEPLSRPVTILFSVATTQFPSASHVTI